MWKYPLRYQLLDYFFDFLFFGILNEDPRPGESMFVRWALPLQMLKMIAVAGVLAAASCLFVPPDTAVVIWLIASFFLMLFGSVIFTAY